MTLGDVFKELDAAARANLTPAGVDRYERYKATLIADNESPEDVDAILRGFIWNELEESE